ncbi:hypothetical protein JQX13_33360 [Archangium violaceum]|uniref:hypothetical protein n=1 Tax=Archangium violaceum TaxID=83451 RepID=UPI00193AF098|nr:hypothetical protein [Archangium violaceum]QRK05071.1 hypothetical protein JQX13_33360 [Archangium violaceum]
MNTKALATIIGTLSLGSLAAGCATASGSAAPRTEKGAQGSCSTTSGEVSCSGKATQKGGEASCGEGSCSGAQKAATPEKGSLGGCGENSCAGGR